MRTEGSSDVPFPAGFVDPVPGGGCFEALESAVRLAVDSAFATGLAAEDASGAGGGFSGAAVALGSAPATLVDAGAVAEALGAGALTSGAGGTGSAVALVLGEVDAWLFMYATPPPATTNKRTTRPATAAIHIGTRGFSPGGGAPIAPLPAHDAFVCPGDGGDGRTPEPEIAADRATATLPDASVTEPDKAPSGGAAPSAPSENERTRSTDPKLREAKGARSCASSAASWTRLAGSRSRQ